MKNKLITIIVTVFLVLFIINISLQSFALVEDYKGGSNFQGSDKTIQSAIGAVLSAVRYAGVGIATIMLLVIATKYLLASAGERADIKKYAVSYVTGALILFGASGIVGIIKNLVTSAIT